MKLAIFFCGMNVPSWLQKVTSDGMYKFTFCPLFTICIRDRAGAYHLYPFIFLPHKSGAKVVMDFRPLFYGRKISAKIDGGGAGVLFHRMPENSSVLKHIRD